MNPGAIMLRYVLLICILQGIAGSAIAQRKSKDPMSWKDILNRAGPPVHSPAPDAPALVPEPGDDVFGPNPFRFTPPPVTHDSLQNGNLKVVNVSEYDALYMRELPTENSQILGMIPPDGNGIVSLGERKNNWILVRYEDVEGWIDSQFVATEDE